MHVAVLEDMDVIYIAKVDSSHAVRMVSATGRRLPAHCTAVGKMLLAGLPEAVLEERLDANTAGRELVRMTPRSITDPDALRAALAEIRILGVAGEQQESNPDVSCVAAPVRDRSGRVVAALSVSVPVHRWTEERENELTALAVKGANELSERLGHRAAR